jgi:hypothetical protein
MDPISYLPNPLTSRFGQDSSKNVFLKCIDESTTVFNKRKEYDKFIFLKEYVLVYFLYTLAKKKLNMKVGF